MKNKIIFSFVIALLIATMMTPFANAEKDDKDQGKSFQSILDQIGSLESLITGKPAGNKITDNPFDTISHELTNLKSIIQGLQNKDGTLSQQVTDLTNKNNALKQQVNDLTNQNNILSQQITDLTGQNNALKQQVSSLSDQISSLNQQVTDLTGKNNSLQQQITDLTSQNSALSQQITDLTNQNNALKQQITTLQNTLASDPVITIKSPSDGTTLHTGAITVTGTASDVVPIQSIQASIDGGAFAQTTGAESWSYTTPVLNSGTHTVTIKATNTNGGISSSSVSITSATSNPVILIDPLQTSNVVTGQYVKITGRVVDTVDVNNVQVSIFPEGQFFQATGTSGWQVILPTDNISPGTKTIIVTATDILGSTATRTSSITILGTPNPTLTISSPSNGATFTNGQSITISGVASDTLPIQVFGSVDGGQATLISNTGQPNVSWTYNVGTLGTGAHYITILAIDTTTATVSKSLAIQVQ